MLRRQRDHGPFFFVHLQKTAGTSLSSQMRERFGTSAVYPDDSDRESCGPDGAESVLSVSHLQERWAERRSQIRVITGHFPLCTTDLLEGDFRTFTLLRDPVDRTLSYLRHARETLPGAQDLSLEEIYEDPVRYEWLVHNHMVKMFSLTADEILDEAALTFDAPLAFADIAIGLSERQALRFEIHSILRFPSVRE